MLRIRAAGTYANVTATLALFIALGGGAYAATVLPANSVGARQLKSSAVERGKIKNSAVNSAKVRDNSLTGADINEGALGKVASAAAADSATSAVRALTAAALDKVTYKFAVGTAPPNTDSTAATATCDAGQRVIGGGVRLDDPTTGLTDDSYPDPASNYTAWTAHVASGPLAQNFTVYAICTTATTVG
jgi:hypothetical protein